MKNQLFLAAEDAVNQRKLDIALRQFTSDRLTEKQREIIETAVGYDRQCYLIVCPSAQKFCQTLAVQDADPKRMRLQMLYGSLELLPAYPAAALVYRYRPALGMSSTVYLYIP